MGHKTLIGGTAYDIKGGKTLINGTGYDIKKGVTLIGGTGYDISFHGEPVPVYISKHFSNDVLAYASLTGYAGFDQQADGAYLIPTGTVLTTIWQKQYSAYDVVSMVAKVDDVSQDISHEGDVSWTTYKFYYTVAAPCIINVFDDITVYPSDNSYRGSIYAVVDTSEEPAMISFSKNTAGSNPTYPYAEVATGIEMSIKNAGSYILKYGTNVVFTISGSLFSKGTVVVNGTTVASTQSTTTYTWTAVSAEISFKQASSGVTTVTITTT